MPLWNIVLSGYPGAGKTKLAQRLVADNHDFIRLNVDDLRAMYFGSTAPSEQEDFVYNSLATLRDAILSSRRSAVIDTTAPGNDAREFLLDTRIRNVTELLILMVVEKSVLEDRNQKRQFIGAVDAWDKAWQNPAKNMPVMKFRNNSPAEFETSYYILTDLLASKMHPFKRRFFANIYPRNLNQST
jgi:predicted kinase